MAVQKVEVVCHGTVSVEVPDRVPEKLAKLLAGKLVGAKIIAAFDADASLHEDALDDFLDTSPAASVKDWDDAKILSVDATWFTSELRKSGRLSNQVLMNKKKLIRKKGDKSIYVT